PGGDEATARVTWFELTGESPAAENWMTTAPDPLIARFVKVATPFTALTVVVPESVPVPDPIVAVTAPEPVTGLLFASGTGMTGGAGRRVPDVALADGCTVTANWFAGGGCVLPIVKLFDVAVVKPVMMNASVYVPAPVIARFVNVATPLTAFTTVVPD